MQMGKVLASLRHGITAETDLHLTRFFGLTPGYWLRVQLAFELREAQHKFGKKVERQVDKSAAAMLLSPSIGRQFDATVTGASDKGMWVRISQPPVEGKLESGPAGLRVGDRLRVQLIHTDVERGYIDFKGVGARLTAKSGS